MTRSDSEETDAAPGASAPSAANDLLHRLVHATVELAVVGLDLRGTITEWNTGAETLHGYSLEEVRGQRLDVLFAPERIERGDVDAFLEKARSSGRAKLEGWRERKDGSRFWALDILTLLREDGGELRGFGLVVQEGTPRENEERVLQAQRMESLGRLVGAVTHDFNNMLTAIMINTHILLRDLPEDSPRRMYVKEIEAIAGHAGSLTQQILAYSGSDPPAGHALDLNELVSAAGGMLRRLIGENIKLTTHLDPRLMSVRADPVQVQQVLLNLVVNARDAMPGGGRITIETRTSAAEEVLLTVSDTGIGMDEDTRKRMFEPFFTTRGEGNGTGLGLATVKTIVRRYGGRIEVDTERGWGTTFRITFPPAPGAPTKTQATDGSKPEGGSETLLLVEDDPALRSAARDVLEREGYRVLDAKGGSDALWLATRGGEAIDLLISDVRMPGMSGIELARRLRRLRPRMRVLFISGYAEEIPPLDLAEPGTDFLSKPFPPPVLARAIRKILKETPPLPSGSSPPPPIASDLLNGDEPEVSPERE